LAQQRTTPEAEAVVVMLVLEGALAEMVAGEQEAREV
jgi:hypothetical protein